MDFTREHQVFDSAVVASTDIREYLDQFIRCQVSQESKFAEIDSHDGPLFGAHLAS